jgi:hypothetical protein
MNGPERSDSSSDPGGGGHHEVFKPIPEDEAGRIGVFPNWRWLYTTVVIYGVVVIVVLLFLTRFLSFGATP